MVALCGGDLKKQRGETFSMGSVVEAGPCVTQTLTLEENYQFFFVFNSSHFLCVPCNSTFCGGGSLAKLRRRARPRKRRTKGNRTFNASFQNILLIFFSKTISTYLLCGRPRHPEYLIELVKDVPGKAQR